MIFIDICILWLLLYVNAPMWIVAVGCLALVNELYCTIQDVLLSISIIKRNREGNDDDDNY